MLVWEKKLYLFDIAKDIKYQFVEEIRIGKGESEIKNDMLSQYSDSLQDEEDCPLFWFAFADTAWNLGQLDQDTKEFVLVLLDKKWGFSDSDLICKGLKMKLLSAQPKRKQLRKRALFRCLWKDGDTYALRIESEFAKEKGIAGRSFLFYKIGEVTVWPGHVLPVVWIKVTESNNLPKNKEEFDQMAFLCTGVRKYENRYWLLDDNASEEEQLKENERLRKMMDKDGFLREYRISLSPILEPTKSRLVYIGNYSNIRSPKNEFVPRVAAEIFEMQWKFFDRFAIDLILQNRFDR